MNNIVVIGSCNLDITVLANKRPVAGETILGTGLNMSPGGKGANQAVAAAKLGAQVTMVGCIGNDAYGDIFEKTFANYGINTDYLVRLDDVTTGTAHITLAEGDNSIIVIMGANAHVDATVIDHAWDAIKEADLVLVQNEIPLSTIGYIANRCQKEQIPLLINPAPAGDLKPEWLAAATYITPNEHELASLYPHMSTEEVLLHNEEKIIVTLGKEGVSYAKDGHIKTIPAFVMDPVDTTGAGDTFNGAFATAIVNGKSLEEALRFGNAAAALSITRLGAQGGMPTRDEVMFLVTTKE